MPKFWVNAYKRAGHVGVSYESICMTKEDADVEAKRMFDHYGDRRTCCIEVDWHKKAGTVTIE